MEGIHGRWLHTRQLKIALRRVNAAAAAAEAAAWMTPPHLHLHYLLTDVT